MAKCGYVAIIGRPNVGKSTLLNQLLGQKISITSKKPQTTRHRILGIKTTNDTQMIFIDTPGMHAQNRRMLNRLLNKAALASLHDVDVILWLIEPRINAEDDFIQQKLVGMTTPIILAINKIDKLADKAQLLPLTEELQKKFLAKEVVPISAERNENLTTLCQVISRYLPPQEFIYAEDELTDKSMRFLTAEIIREKLMRFLGAELPYATTVQIDDFKETETLVDIAATIFVERTSQKAIVIGAGGGGLKKIGTEARKDLERLLQKKVMLRLWVKVKDNWADDEAALKSLGYGD